MLIIIITIFFVLLLQIKENFVPYATIKGSDEKIPITITGKMKEDNLILYNNLLF